jgi:hypothetical protein
MNGDIGSCMASNNPEQNPSILVATNREPKIGSRQKNEKRKTTTQALARSVTPLLQTTILMPKLALERKHHFGHFMFTRWNFNFRMFVFHIYLPS